MIFNVYQDCDGHTYQSFRQHRNKASAQMLARLHIIETGDRLVYRIRVRMFSYSEIQARRLKRTKEFVYSKVHSE